MRVCPSLNSLEEDLVDDVRALACSQNLSANIKMASILNPKDQGMIINNGQTDALIIIVSSTKFDQKAQYVARDALSTALLSCS